MQLSENNLLTTVVMGSMTKVYYALEGSIFIAGELPFQWLRGDLRMIDDSHKSGAVALKSQELGWEIYVVLPFTGLGAPY